MITATGWAARYERDGEDVLMPVVAWDDDGHPMIIDRKGRQLIRANSHADLVEVANDGRVRDYARAHERLSTADSQLDNYYNDLGPLHDPDFTDEDRVIALREAEVNALVGIGHALMIIAEKMK